jgi:ATP-dependent protease HslVU (ClpYQ) peptidase subunit
MTTVIAVKHAKGVTFVADTQATGEGGDIYRVIKVRRNKHFIVSGSGDCAPLDIALHLWKPPVCTTEDKEDLLHYMIVKVVPSLKKVFKDNDYEYDSSPDAKQDGFTLILAVYGEIFIVEKEFDVSQPQFNVAGGGSGAAYAIGALRTGASIEDALAVAAENDSNTSAPFTTLEQLRK